MFLEGIVVEHVSDKDTFYIIYKGEKRKLKASVYSFNILNLCLDCKWRCESKCFHEDGCKEPHTLLCERVNIDNYTWLSVSVFVKEVTIYGGMVVCRAILEERCDKCKNTPF